MPTQKRVLGSYTQGHPGPLLICIVGVHGNEQAGIKAMDLIFKMLEVEPITNPSFVFEGKMICFQGNLPAIAQNIRYIDSDLNRLWKPEVLYRLESKKDQQLTPEEKELRRLKRAIDREIRQWPNDQVYLLDLHTTTATGGIFTLPTEDAYTLEIAQTMIAPVILGLVERLEGTLLQHYVQRYEEKSVVGIVFEAGQHDDPLSVNRTIAAVINYMRTIGSVSPEHIVNRHADLLKSYAEGLPKVARLLYVHRIEEGDHFKMVPGFENFQEVAKGTVMAHDRRGEIKAACDGLVLMPHYQSKGNDGFFMIKPIVEE